MTDFSPVSAVAGGVLIGLGAVVLLLANGRIAGIAGILGSVLSDPAARDSRWRLAFLAGMVTPAVALGAVGRFEIQGAGLSLPLLLAAGFLVGFGTRMGNGCTSGHGICGLARLSKRSAAAVATFMAAATVTVFVMRHVVGG
ncbi:MAG TPA: YeeE/YedE family protein [Candidatus Omnitrophota bacterium]|nr:YeeE/YedE family protein [Candidatus Omnitrophota bacterium]